MSGDNAVRLEAVSKRFGPVTAASDITLDVRRGEFLTLLGPSGCGKTTLLNLIAGFVEPDRGDIYIDGQRVTETPPYQRSLGVVFQNYALFPHMSVAQNVAFGLKMRKVGAGEIRARVQQALDIVHLAGLGERRPRQLSGGQQQRVALARALVVDPKVLLLDEPLSALDKNLRAEMQVELKQIQRRVGVTTVFVTHDQGEALSLSDRIAVMSDGAILQLATPAGVYRRPASSFVASFIGNVNRLSARLAAIDGGTARVEVAAGGSVDVPLERCGVRTPGRDVLLYVRPESLRLAREGEVTAALAAGTVQAHVFQGTHVDVYVDCAGLGLVNVRAASLDTAERWPVGRRVAVQGDMAEAFVFARDEAPPT
ncbi:MAG: ABC transporter ATP-binding protein [Proteobacteria bacterium]|nr:ABC transporter ATP-binding protein [Pseudomonadota bacterium]